MHVALPGDDVTLYPVTGASAVELAGTQETSTQPSPDAAETVPEGDGGLYGVTVTGLEFEPVPPLPIAWTTTE